MEGGIMETGRSNLHPNYNHKPLVLLAGALTVIATLMFASHRYYSMAKAIDGSLWGEFGDFIGGVVGTIIAYISIRLLIDTLGAQNKANQIASETAKDNDYTYRLQQLNDHFQMLLKLYRETLSQFGKPNETNGKTGQAYLHETMLKMREKMQNSQTTFENRNIEAISLFLSFYTEHRDVASVYFRIIYRLWELLFDTKLYLRDKLRYAKILRCQFSEAELFMLRYNAYTSNGKKMQKYINQFNVTKHLPELSLLEFSYWRDSKFDDVYDEMQGLNWGELYERFHHLPLNHSELSAKVHELMRDDFVTNRRGIFEYVLGGCQDTRLLNVRLFDKPTMRKVYQKQTEKAKAEGISNCPYCAEGHEANRHRIWKPEEMDADHVTAWSKGGSTSIENCQMLCKTHNRMKGNR